MTTQPQLSSEFPFTSNYVDVHGSKMHYIDEGEGKPILFLHGVPTWSYMWRHMIPEVSQHSRCIAVDLIGLGKSDKPDMPYRVFDHIKYIEGFIEALNLKDVTLMMHGWGSVIGFDYAMRHQNNVAGLAFFEARVRSILDEEMIALPVKQWRSKLQSADGGFNEIMDGNALVNEVMPSGSLRKLTEEEMQHYREPFAQAGSCLPLWQYVQDLPCGEKPADVVELISRYSKALQTSDIPKLMMFGVPGFFTTIETVQWAKDNLPNLSLVDLDEAMHYAPEYKPHEMSSALIEWYQQHIA